MANFWKTNHLLQLSLILILAATLRFYGLNWDQNQHLHPDERFLTMVTEALEWPKSIPEYFSTPISPLNPANKNFPFFVYGTFPLFLVKAAAQILNLTDYDHLVLMGRALSGLFDLGTVVIVFLIGKKAFSSKAGLLAALLYTVAVLPIQQAHFFTVDTFTNFFMLAAFYLLLLTLTRPSWWLIIFSAILFGLGVSSKINALLLLPVFLLVALSSFLENSRRTLYHYSVFFLLALLTFRIFDPYAFSATSIFDLSLTPLLKSLMELNNLASPSSSYPPSVQWFHTTPLLYPLRDIIFWGLGLPLGIAAFLGTLALTIKTFRVLIATKLQVFRLSFTQNSILLLLTFTGSVFFYQGIQFAKAMRYFLPLYPPLLILTAFFLESLKLSRPIKLSFLILALIWPLSFVSIYTQPHTRVQASEWIYKNIPAGSQISYEYWDDPLPLNLPQHSSSIYQGVRFPLYDSETSQKWEQMAQNLNQTNYIILSSNRLYGSITRSPEKYPQTNQFYKSLFDGSLGFTKVAEFTSRPVLPVPFLHICLRPPFTNYGIIAHQNSTCPNFGLNIIDDYADEMFTVYDHPKVIIFQKVAPINLPAVSLNNP